MFSSVQIHCRTQPPDWNLFYSDSLQKSNPAAPSITLVLAARPAWNLGRRPPLSLLSPSRRLRPTHHPPPLRSHKFSNTFRFVEHRQHSCHITTKFTCWRGLQPAGACWCAPPCGVHANKHLRPGYSRRATDGQGLEFSDLHTHTHIELHSHALR